MAIETKQASEVYDLRTPYLEQGRTTDVRARTDLMTVTVKVYAEGGENAMHHHTHEDHSFIVLEGEATFHLETDDNAKVVRRYEGSPAIALEESTAMEWKVSRERPLYVDDWLDVRVADVELPDGQHLEPWRRADDSAHRCRRSRPHGAAPRWDRTRAGSADRDHAVRRAHGGGHLEARALVAQGDDEVSRRFELSRG